MGKNFTNQAADMSSFLRKSPIKASDIAKIRKNYDIAAAWKPKGKSDTEIYNFSRDTVIAQWRKKKAAEAAAAKASQGGAGGGAAPGGAGSGGGSAPAGGGLVGSGVASGAGAGSNVTPVNKGVVPGKAGGTVAKPITQGVGAGAAKAGGTVAKGAGAGAKPAATVAKSAGVGTTQLQTALAAAGLKIPISSVPPTARTSTAALVAWIASQKAPAKASGVIAKPVAKATVAAPKAPTKPLRKY